MSKARTFMILGIWIAILPYMGFPYSWKNLLFSLTGLVIASMSYVLYKEYQAKEGKQKGSDNFKENNFERSRKIADTLAREERSEENIA